MNKVEMVICGYKGLVDPRAVPLYAKRNRLVDECKEYKRKLHDNNLHLYPWERDAYQNRISKNIEQLIKLKRQIERNKFFVEFVDINSALSDNP